MSSAFVRDTLRAVVPPLVAPDFAFIESVNDAERSEDLPDQWITLDFLPADDARIALGRPTLFRESGTCSVMIFTPHQLGDSTGLACAQLVRDGMANYSLGDFRISDAAPPAEMDGGDFRGQFYGLIVSLRYQFDHFVD